jgi:RNA polymerase sigma factor (sigma-70 family)
MPERHTSRWRLVTNRRVIGKYRLMMDPGGIAADAALLVGSPAEFGAFYLRHEAGVLGFFLRRVGGASDLAADLCAETFARALEGRRSFDSTRGEARGWLFGIARHVLAESLERGRVLDETRVRLRLEPLVLDDEDLARIAELGDEPAVRALEELAADQREAVAGRVIDQRNYEELAASLRCSPSLVRQRVSRGLRSMRQRLEGAQ